MNKMSLPQLQVTAEVVEEKPLESDSLLEARLQLFNAAWEYFATLHIEELPGVQYSFTLKSDKRVVWEVNSNDIRSLPREHRVQHKMFFKDREKRGTELRVFKRSINYTKKKCEQANENLRKANDLYWAMQRDGADYQRVVKERDWLFEENQRKQKKIKELVLLTERCGEKLRTSEDKIDTLMRTTHQLSKERKIEKSVLSNSTQLAERLIVKMDECSNNLEEACARTRNLEALLAKSREKNRLLEEERRILSSRRSGQLADLLTELYAQYSSDEQVKNNTNESNTARPYLRGLGVNSSVPVYMRFTGRVRNLFISKGMLEKIIQEMWVSRYILHALHEDLPDIAKPGIVGGKAAAVALRCVTRNELTDHFDYGNVLYYEYARCPFQEFFHSYICERWLNATEWAYSLVDAMGRFKYDADVEMFYEVLNGNLPEEVFLDQTVMLHKFKKVLNLVDLPDEIVESWREQGVTLDLLDCLPFDTIMEEVSKFFHTKSQDQVESIRLALQRDIQILTDKEGVYGSCAVPWMDLFQQDNEGNQMSFVEALRDQHLEEVAIFMSSLSDAIDAAQQDGYCTPIAIKQQVLALDPHRPEEDIHLWLNIFLGNDPRDPNIKWEKPYPVGDLVSGAKLVLQRRRGSPSMAYDTRQMVIAQKDGRLGIAIGPDLDVKKVKPGGSAAESGLEVGMYIWKIDGKVIDNRDTYSDVMKDAGTTVCLDVKVKVAASLAGEVCMPWLCKQCRFDNPRRTLQCRVCAAENPLKQEAEDLYRKLVSKRAMGNVFVKEELAEFNILSPVFEAHQAQAAPPPTSRGWKALRKVTSSLLPVKRDSVATATATTTTTTATWSREEDNRVRELTSKAEPTDDERLELARLQEGFNQFIEEGLRQMTPGTPAPPSPSCQRADPGEWTRDDDMRKRDLDHKPVLNENERIELKRLTEKFELYISNGLAQMIQMKVDGDGPAPVSPAPFSFKAKFSKMYNSAKNVLPTKQQ